MTRSSLTQAETSLGTFEQRGQNNSEKDYSKRLFLAFRLYGFLCDSEDVSSVAYCPVLWMDATSWIHRRYWYYRLWISCSDIQTRIIAIRITMLQMNPDFLDTKAESSEKPSLESCILRSRIPRKGDSNGTWYIYYAHVSFVSKLE